MEDLNISLPDGLSAISIIKQRHSCRTFDSRPIETEDESKIRAFMDGLSDAGCRFILTSPTDKSGRLGTYGVIKGADTYIVCVMKRSDFNKAPEQTGYKFENIVLYATSLGLGTCWMSGTFRRSQFDKAINIKEDEFIPYVSPIGYPAEKKRLTEKFMRMMVRSDGRKPARELFFFENLSTPLTFDNTKFAIPLQMLRIAPSASNRQPWRIVKVGDYHHFYYTGSKHPSITRSDIGIGMCHFELTSHELGLPGGFTSASHPEFGNLVYVASWKE